jgi:two-component system response regulator HydG
VGGTAAIPVDVRVVAATNRDLEDDIKRGRFRTDLYYRLNVIAIHLPPLRERRDDIEIFVTAFLERIGRERADTPKRLDPEAFEAIMRYDWPGNVRELENALARAVAMSQGNVLLPSDLPPKVAMDPSQLGQLAIDSDWPPLAELERRYIERVMARTDGNKTAAAAILGIDRRTLQRLFAREGGGDDPGS